MKLKELKSRLEADQVAILEKVIVEKYFTEKQALRVLLNGFKVSRKLTDAIFSSRFNSFYALAVSMIQLRVNQHPKQHNNLIKRLLSKQLFLEAVNEMYCHLCLSHQFSSYEIFPLFSDAPDGRLIFEKEEIHVEIKSRFPKFVELLYKLFEDLSNKIKPLKNENVSIKTELSKLSKFSEKDAKDICRKFETVCNDFLHSPNRKGNINATTTIEFENICLTIQITISKKPVLSNSGQGGLIVGLSKEEVDEDCLWLNKWVQVVSVDEHGVATFSGDTTFKVTLDETSKSFLADVVVKECIKRISNLPREPNMIVIYSDHLANEHFAEHMQSIFDEYVGRHEYTCILGCYITFTADDPP